MTLHSNVVTFEEFARLRGIDPRRFDAAGTGRSRRHQATHQKAAPAHDRMAPPRDCAAPALGPVSAAPSDLSLVGPTATAVPDLSDDRIA